APGPDRPPRGTGVERPRPRAGFRVQRRPRREVVLVLGRYGPRILSPGPFPHGRRRVETPGRRRARPEPRRRPRVFRRRRGVQPSHGAFPRGRDGAVLARRISGDRRRRGPAAPGGPRQPYGIAREAAGPLPGGIRRRLRRLSALEAPRRPRRPASPGPSLRSHGGGPALRLLRLPLPRPARAGGLGSPARP